MHVFCWFRCSCSISGERISNHWENRWLWDKFFGLTWLILSVQKLYKKLSGKCTQIWLLGMKFGQLLPVAFIQTLQPLPEQSYFKRLVHLWSKWFCWRTWKQNNLEVKAELDLLIFLCAQRLLFWCYSSTSKKQAQQFSFDLRQPNSNPLWGSCDLPVSSLSIVSTTNFASSILKHIGGLNLSTFLPGPSVLSRIYSSLSLERTITILYLCM